jgi:type IV pilus assembly protein PilE
MTSDIANEGQSLRSSRVGTRRRGFTLIECMVVVAAIAILASVAVPGYQRYAYRARRVEAKESLVRIAHAQERYYATYHRYAQDLVGELRFAGDRTGRGNYRIGLSTPSPGIAEGQGYVAIAYPQGAQSADLCAELSINHQGLKAPIASDPDKNANGVCW